MTPAPSPTTRFLRGRAWFLQITGKIQGRVQELPVKYGLVKKISGRGTGALQKVTAEKTGKTGRDSNRSHFVLIFKNCMARYRCFNLSERDLDPTHEKTRHAVRPGLSWFWSLGFSVSPML